MIGLGQLLHREDIVLELQGRRKSAVLRELVGLLHQNGKVSDPASILKGLLERERMASTGIGQGIAIPHLLTNAVPETVLAFGRRRAGILFNAIDGEPVTLVFLIIGPKSREYQHLMLLSHLSRLLHSAVLRGRLIDAASPEEVLEILSDAERREG